MRILNFTAWLGVFLAAHAQAQADVPAAGGLVGRTELSLNMALPVAGAAVLVWVWRWVARRKNPNPDAVAQPVNHLALACAAAVLVVGLCGTAYRAHTSNQEIYADVRLRFQLQVDQVENSIQERFTGLLAPLRGVRGALLASDYLSRSEFRTFVQSRDMDQEFPGVRGLGVIERVMRPELPAFVQRERKNGAPDFAVKTSGQAPDLLIIKYVEPEAQNRAAIGLDVGAEPVRRAAAEKAMREGQPALTGHIHLVQDGQKRPGFLYYLPYYDSIKVPTTEADRIRLFKGLSYAPIVLAELMGQTLDAAQGMTHFQLFDGSDAAANALIYDSTVPLGQTDLPAGPDHVLGSLFNTSRPVLIGGRLLLLRASTSARFEQAVDLKAPGRTAFYGALLSVLASAMVWLLLNARARAMAIAQGMTSELRRMALVAQRTSNAVVFTDVQCRIAWVNDGFTRITGYSLAEAAGQLPGRLLQNSHTDQAVVESMGKDLRARRGGTYELINQRKDGSEYWIRMEINPLANERGDVTGFMAVQTDVTDERNSREALRLEKERADTILAGTNVGTWQSHLQSGAFSCNERWCAMMGYALDEMVPNAHDFWRRQVHPDDWVRVRNGLQRCRHQQVDAYSVEVRVRHKDGRWLWISSRAKVMSRTPDGDVEWMGGIHTDITDTKTMEIGLRDMESFLHRAGRLAGVGAWEVDIKTQRVKWSEQTCQIFGVESDFQPTLGDMLSFYSEADRLRMRAAIQNAIDHSSGWDVTAKLFNARGEHIWVRASGEPEFDDSGAVRLVGAIQDVTREKQAQLHIERSEAILRESIDAVNEAYVLFDPQDRLVLCNEKYRELYAASADLIVPGATFESIIRGGAERGQYRAAVGRVDEWVAERMKIHLAAETLMEQQLDDGRWLRVVERQMADGHRVGFRVDITELKQANQAAQAANMSLAQTSATLQTVLDSAVNVGVIAVDRERRVTVFNKGAENLTGYAAADMMNRRALGILFERSQMDLVRESMALQLGREPDELEVFLHVAHSEDTPEWTLVRKDTSTFIASMVISPMVDIHGELEGYLAVTYDVTRQKEYEASLRVAMRRAEESSVAKSQFLANMSHEIRTPMNAILGMLQLLHSTPLSPQQLDYADKTEGAAKSLLGLINDILDFSKVEAGKMELNPEPFALGRLLDDLSVILSSNLGGKNLDLLFDVDPEIPAILVGDALRLKQVLINLGGNAVKFTEQGHVTLRLRLLYRKPDRVKLEVAVVDTGIGIAPENQDRVFESFTQAEASTTRRFGGTGLGLVISKRLIRLMGGELELISALGEGSTFRFTLELQVPPQVQSDGEGVTATESVSESGFSALLVDDNPAALASSAAIMQSLGWDVTLADSGEQAVALVQARREHLPFSAVFADWQMPGMDGWETLRAIRGVVGAAEAPALVLMSGQTRAALNQRSERERALLNGYMVKPLTADMFRKVRMHLHDAPAVATTAMAVGAEAPGEPPRVTHPLAGMRILVVEDNAINQQVARELLLAQGADVTLANDGQQGVQAALEAQPSFDVVLMDLQMPVMDGLTAARTLRETSELDRMPIIAMTANVMSTDREACLRAGMNDHVGKPFDIHDLVETLVRHTGWSPRPDAAVAASPVATGASATLSDLPWPPGVDVPGALHRMGGNVGLLSRATTAFVQDASTLPQRLTAMLASGALADARRELHTIKGLSASLGMAALARLASDAEKLTVAPVELAHLQAACDAFFVQLHQMLPALSQVAAGLEGTVRAGNPARHKKSGTLGESEKSELVGSLRKLQAALEMSDMSAMELHAQLRQAAGDVAEEAMLGLDAAMADLDFVLAAQACGKLIALWS